MKNKLLICLITAFYSSFIFFSDASAIEIKTVQQQESITPYFTYMISCYNNLKLESGGRLICVGDTELRPGYTAGVKVELQRYVGTWNTIKTWESKGLEYAYVDTSWYVVKGYDYRLKVTHSALDNSGAIIENSLSYSVVVSYF